MTPQERERRIREIAERLAERLADQWPEADQHINDLEDFAERMGRDVQRELSEGMVREQAERKDGNQSACACGGTATFRDYHTLTMVTLAGRLRVRRAYYYCDRCRQGHCPADRRLELGPAHTTPAAQARLAVLGALAPFAQIRALVAQLGLPLQLDIKSTERVTQAVGRQLAATTVRPHGPAERAVAVGFDGVMIPTWEGYKEARVGVIYEPNWEAGRTPEAEAGLRKEYFGTTGSRESLVRTVCARARERAHGERVAVVCDGAALDWLDLEALLPYRMEILDFYHVAERLAEIAKAWYPEEETARKAWVSTISAALQERGPRPLLEALRHWEPTTAEAREVRRLQLAYFERQQERMWYPTYLRLGYPIGSGAVEGACKHVVAARFDASGMRWKPATADPVMRLRAALLTQPGLDLRRFAGARATPVTV